MSLSDIIRLVPPPRQPVSGNGRSWDSIQKFFDNKVPDSLEGFGHLYGSGIFKGGDQIRILNPFDPEYYGEIQFYCRTYMLLREESPHYYPYYFYPEEGGLFPIADGSCRISFWALPRTESGQVTVVFDDQKTGLLEFPVRCLFEFFHRFFLNQIEDSPYFTEEIKFVPGVLPSW